MYEEELYYPFSENKDADQLCTARHRNIKQVDPQLELEMVRNRKLGREEPVTKFQPCPQILKWMKYLVYCSDLYDLDDMHAFMTPVVVLMTPVVVPVSIVVVEVHWM